jgi:hypothetical protein
MAETPAPVPPPALPPVPAGPPLLARVKRFAIKWTLLGVFLSGVGFALWTWGSLTFVYSKGERAGYVQKFSKRGWLFKTWEGQLAMVNLPGAMPEIFEFTVRDAATAVRIEQTMGRRVAVTYHQHRGIPSRIFGDTQYFVVNVTPVEELPPASVAPAIPVAPTPAPGAPTT